LTLVIPGRPKAEPGIHNHEFRGKNAVPIPADLWLWIPGSPLRGAPE
jgi:hypothetical protein